MTRQLCGAREAACICILELDHVSRAHVCSCGGSWQWTDGEFEVISWPSHVTPTIEGEPCSD